MSKSLPALCMTLVLAPLFVGCADRPDSSRSAQAGEPSGPVREPLASGFYAKRCETGGVRIAASAKVDDAALAEVARILSAMTADRPDLLRDMSDRKVGVAVIAAGEFTTDLPDRAALRPRRFYDLHRRASCATPENRVVTIGEENLLGFPGDPDAGRCLLVREVGRSILTLLRRDDAELSAGLDEAYALSLKKRIPGEPLAPPTREDYWADGVMAWFGAGDGPDRDGLLRSDPALAGLVGKIFGKGTRKISPAKTTEAPGARVFTIPPEFPAWEARFRRGEETLTTPGTAILPSYPAALHRSMRPGNIAEWRSPATPGAPTTIHFVNVSASHVHIDLMRADGGIVSYGTLYVGRHLDVETTVGAVWRIANPITGKAISYTVAEQVPGLRLVNNPEEEDAEFQEEGEYESEVPAPVTLHPVSERDRWSSYESGKETSLCLDNRGSVTLILHSVDRSGGETYFDKLRPGDAITFTTFADQVWRVSDESGRTLGYACSLARHAILTFTDATVPAK